MTDTTKIEEAATLEAFNLCCNWLHTNGYPKAATSLAGFLNGSGEPPHVADTEVALPGAPALNAEAARGAGFTGSACTHCGNMQMVRNGTCEKCTVCGETTGCS